MDRGDGVLPSRPAGRVSGGPFPRSGGGAIKCGKRKARRRGRRWSGGGAEKRAASGPPFPRWSGGGGAEKSWAAAASAGDGLRGRAAPLGRHRDARASPAAGRRPRGLGERDG